MKGDILKGAAQDSDPGMASFAQSAQAQQGAGQNHDRMPSRIPPGAPDDSAGNPVEITAVQKMISATSGSLLTGLLGMFVSIGLDWRS